MSAISQFLFTFVYYEKKQRPVVDGDNEALKKNDSRSINNRSMARFRNDKRRTGLVKRGVKRCTVKKVGVRE